MSIDFKEYDADRIFCALGAYIITAAGGLADGSFVTVKFKSPLYTEKVGVDGTRTRSRTNDKSFTASIKVMQSSEANVFLAGFVSADLALNNGAGVTSFTLKDLSGNTLIYSPKSYIAMLPETDFDREAGVRQYDINGSWVGAVVLGGN